MERFQKLGESLQEHMNIVLASVVVVILAVACITSVVSERMKYRGAYGRVLEVNILYDEPPVYAQYAKVDFSTIEHSDEINQLIAEQEAEAEKIAELYADADGGTVDASQIDKDSYALQTLLQENVYIPTEDDGRSKGDEAKARSGKYNISKLQTVGSSSPLSFNPGVLAGNSAVGSAVYASGGTYLGQYVLTGYCPCAICCGKTNGITACGTLATSNHTVAADPSIPFGTKLIINGQLYTVEDRGGAIKGNHIDIFFNTHQEALDFGRQLGDVFLYQ